MASFIKGLHQRLLFLAVFLSISGVLCFSELFFMREPHDVTVIRREAVVLDCQAHGEAPIAVRWLKNGRKLIETEHIYQLANGSLLISEPGSRKDKSDEGFYQCLAQNKYGSILSHRARLTIASLSAFSQHPSSITVTEGWVARFACKITATPPPIITWEFNRVTLPLATERIAVLPGGILQIQGVEREDAGSYRCVATNIASRRKSSEAVLTVTAAPSSRVPQRPCIVAVPQNLTIAIRSSALLECMATGSPRPLISWSRADHKSIDVHNTKVLGNGNLLISDIKPQHAGVYFCRATTPGTRNFTLAAANITVLAPPSFVEWPESVTRPRAGTARFVCVAQGFPEPQITWLKNGQTLHSNGRIKMYNSKLVINQIIPEDDGIYQCQAENQLGSVLAMARLIVVMSDNRPSAPRNVRADTMSSSAILLAWERPVYNSDKVIAYSVHYMKTEGLNNEEYQIVIGNDTTRYIIDDLVAGRNYTFYIVAYMPVGASRMSDPVVQHTLEDVPLRAPELSLSSRSPTDIQVSWQPLSHKLSRGRVSMYRLSYRTSADGAIAQHEVPAHRTHHLLKGLQPDTNYLLRIAAATSVGWGEPSAWTTHRTPKDSSTKVPLAPELQLETLNCTTITVRWNLPAGSAADLQGYKLSYHEESQPEGPPTQIPPHLRQHTIGGLDPRKKYHIKVLAYSVLGEGYQADQTISTPGCVSVRDRLIPPPPPPHHVHAHSNSSTSVYLHWGRPAFTAGQTVNYTVRCNPVGLQNASLVLYLQTDTQSLLVSDLDPNANYEFAVRLHVDQLSSPWSPVVYQQTLPEAPSRAPVGVKVSLIEGDSALVSWKPPDEPNITVTRYTILYASRRAWAAGEWQILQREGSITMALLEKLQSGQVYLVKVSASNQMGDGPFSPAVELTVHSDQAIVFSGGFYHLDQRSMTGIAVGVCIALTCIIICVLILACRSKTRKSCTAKSIRQGGQTPPTAVHLANGSQTESAEEMMPMTRDHFVDAKGGTNLIINSDGPVKPTNEKKRSRWIFFKKDEKDVKKVSSPSYSYYPGTSLLSYTDTSPGSPLHQPSSLQGLFGSSEGNSEGSHSSETGDSGRYTHDDTEGSSSRPASLRDEESEESDRYVIEKEHHLCVKNAEEATPSQPV
ncbi:protogenin A [Triplophysa dalaica]|uniref:protogenin A n=1 Tax=Triplophysa dalaica TaxID=1582913 RepID=UPI0024E0010D|nr:protogenin A [Triplophysa dalaica]